jgi:hypothetical protein
MCGYNNHQHDSRVIPDTIFSPFKTSKKTFVPRDILTGWDRTLHRHKNVRVRTRGKNRFLFPETPYPGLVVPQNTQEVHFPEIFPVHI